MASDMIGRPMEILLIEDSISSARLAIAALRKGDVQHRLTWLTSGDEALEFLFKQGKFARAPRPDLILLDLGLPGKDGREVLAEVRGNQELAGIPVVVMTASTASEDLAQSEELNVDSYLVKPVNLEKFLKVVEELSRYWRADMIVPRMH